MAEKNEFSRKEDENLYSVMECLFKRLITNAKDAYPLPEGYVFEHWKTLKYSLIRKYLLGRGVSENDLTYLTVPNPSGKESAIKPDGGIIVAVKRENEEVVDFYPLLMSESKHQESNQGNAIERLFKNYDAICHLFDFDDITPYVIFCQGKGMGSEYIKNKLRVAAMDPLFTNDIDIHNKIISNGKVERLAKRGCILVRTESWDFLHMTGNLLTALEQSYNYFFNNKKEN